VFGGSQRSEDGLFRLDANVVQVQDENGDWVPVGGASFELVGELESTDPWTVAGTAFEIRETTEIEAGLEVGDLVRVRGVILEDETWVAYSIELADEPTDPIIILIGIVDSIDPWVVNGITLNVTDATDIQGEITVGMIVRVEILLLEDGTWEVLSIAPLGEPGEEPSGCVTVIVTVVSVDGDEIQLLGWPSPVIFEPSVPTESTPVDENGNGDNEEENGNTDDSPIDITTLEAGQVIVAVVCITEDGRIVIVQIIILNTPEDPDDGGTPGDGEKVLVCHKPSKNAHTLSISSSAVPAHLGHGDTLGACP